MTTEFKNSVESGNLLRTRIMLKDSFVTDPTCVQLDTLLAYAKEKLPDILVSYDGGALENDSSKWNLAVMNLELVQLVNNFSRERIDHLKKVVAKVKHEEIKALEERTREKTVEQAKKLRIDSYKRIRNSASRINDRIKEINRRKGWSPKDIDVMEQEAENILAAVQQYKNNK